MRAAKTMYFIKKALGNIRQNLLVNFVAIGTIAVAILIFSTFTMIIHNLTNLVARFEDEIHIVSYLKEGHEKNHDSIMESLLSHERVADVKFVSKEEALEIFRKSLGENDVFLDDIPSNPLPASFEIRLKKDSRNTEGVEDVVMSLNAMGIFDDIAYGREWIKHFNNFLNAFKIIGFAVGGGFLFAAVFIISNTIKLTLYARKEEIEILRLVGATDRFIKAPFIVEGMIQGFCGAVLSIAALYIMYLIFLANVRPLNLVGINPQSMPFLPIKMLVIIVIFSTALGMAGSFVSFGNIAGE